MRTLGIEGFQQLEANNIVKDLVLYIEKELPFFPASQAFVDILVRKKNENKHSAAFCNFMTCQCGARYYFERETSQHGSSTIDIGALLGLCF